MRPAGDTGPPAGPTAAGDGTAADEVADGDGLDVSELGPSETGDFDIAGWLTSRGVKRWPIDTACFRRSDAEEKANNTCLCRGTLTVGGRELLHCQNPHEQPADAPVPYVTHLVLYSVAKGRMTVALDVPTNAAVEGCKADRVAPCWLNLEAAPEGDGLSVRDASLRGCDVVLADLDELIQFGDTDKKRLRHVYRQICASRGQYHWQGDRLDRGVESLGVRTFIP